MSLGLVNWGRTVPTVQMMGAELRERLFLCGLILWRDGTGRAVRTASAALQPAAG